MVGAGALKVAGEINVVGDLSGNNTGNAIDSNLDLGGGTQVIRVGVGSNFAGPSALMLTSVVSNGSLLKTIGYNTNGGSRCDGGRHRPVRQQRLHRFDDHQRRLDPAAAT